MTNATKTLALTFAVLLVITAVVKWESGAEASRAFRSNLVEVDTSNVDKVVINKPQNPDITLQRQDQKSWQVSSGAVQETYPASSSSIQDVISQLNSLKVNAVATRNPDKYTRYKVDSTGIKVSLYNGDELVNGIYVGAPKRIGKRSLNSYVRLVNGDAVYSVPGFLRSSFSQDLDEWRDKMVWNVDQSNITRVDYLYPADSSFTMKKTSNNKWVSSGDTLSQVYVSSALSQLSYLEASGFADSLSTDAFGNEKFAIQIQLEGGQRHRLQLKESPAKSGVYLGTSESFPYVFTVQKSTWDSNVLKSRKEFLKDKGSAR